jgi:hypothetical protein
MAEAGSAARFMFDILDGDKDGRITRAEYIAGFDLIDKDQDWFGNFF